MLDRYAREALQPLTDRASSGLVRLGVSAGAVTASGLALGLAAAAAAATSRWTLALVLWLVSRGADGLDGPVARRTTGGSELGGWFDIVADFTVYGAFVVGCAIGRPDARVALVVLLLTYYVNGTAFLAFSSAVERRRHRTGLEDERSFVFPRGLAEGTETIAVHALLVAFPSAMAPIAWAFAVAVVVTIGQRVRTAVHELRSPAASHRGASS
jgi:phosphatidylserine synthase